MPRGSRASARTALGRGLRQKCPHCGQGPIFGGWADTRRACPVCGLVYERNGGDTWAFTIVGDRLPVALGIILVYFGLGGLHRIVGVLGLTAMVAALVWTSPNRWGAGIALHYLSRVHWPDPADPIPGQPTGSTSNQHHPPVNTLHSRRG